MTAQLDDLIRDTVDVYYHSGRRRARGDSTRWNRRDNERIASCPLLGPTTFG